MCLYNRVGAVRYSIKRYLGRNLKNRRYFKPHSKLLYPSGNGGNYEVIRPNRFSNGLINAKEDLPSNRLNLIEHNSHNYATSASNPTINKFKYNLKSLLPKMDKSMALPYGGINIEALENQKGKLQVQKIFIKDTMHHQKNPREIRDLKNREPANRDQLIQLEALAKQGESRQSENEVYQPFASNKTKVIFTTGNRSNFTSQLRQIDIPVSLQSASTTYGSRINNLENRLEDRVYNLTQAINHPINHPIDQINNSTYKRPYKVRKMYVSRGRLNGNRGDRLNRANETEAENRFKFIHVPASIMESNNKENLVDANEPDEYKNEYKNENYLMSKQETLDSFNVIDQEPKNAMKPEDGNLIELANQKQIVKVFPLGRVALVNEHLNSEAANQISTQIQPHPSIRGLNNLNNLNNLNKTFTTYSPSLASTTSIK